MSLGVASWHTREVDGLFVVGSVEKFMEMNTLYTCFRAVDTTQHIYACCRYILLEHSREIALRPGNTSAALGSQGLNGQITQLAPHPFSLSSYKK